MSADRAQTVAIGTATATIVGIGILYLFVKEFFDPIDAKNNEIVTNSTAAQGADWVALGFEWYLAMAMAIIVFGTIAAAAFQRQGGRL